MLDTLKETVLRKLRERGVVIRHTFDNQDRARYRALYSEDALKNRRFYNIGAGLFSHPFWTNVDFPSEHYGAAQAQQSFIPHDLMSLKPLPIETGSAEVVYTSHTVEHVKDEADSVMFREAHRILKPGGFFRITTGPDAETDYAALMRNDSHWFYWDEGYSNSPDFFKPPAQSSLAQRGLHHVASAASTNCRHPAARKFDDAEVMEVLASNDLPTALDIFTSAVAFQPENPGNHVSWWTHDKAIRMLKEAGFKTAYRCGHGQSRCPILRNTWYFDNTHPQQSLYVEAVKA
ncbi:MAG: methyltransferase domain-containing protein [Bradyrhizobium sp.]